MPRAKPSSWQGTSIAEVDAAFCSEEKLDRLVATHLPRLTMPGQIALAKKQLRNIIITLALGLSYRAQPTPGSSVKALEPIAVAALTLKQAIAALDAKTSRLLLGSLEEQTGLVGEDVLTRLVDGVALLESSAEVVKAAERKPSKKGRTRETDETAALRSLKKLWTRIEGRPEFGEKGEPKEPTFKPLNSFAEDALRDVLKQYHHLGSMAGLINVLLSGTKR